MKQTYEMFDFRRSLQFFLIGRVTVALAIAWLVVFGFACRPAAAQQSSSLSPEQVQDLIKNATPDQLQELRQRGFNAPASPSQTLSQPQRPIVLTPAEARTGSGPSRSTLEGALSSRAGQSLVQFGYDQVGVGGSVSVPQTGAVQDDYVLGPGDEIDVVLRGQENSQFAVTVDRNGQVALPKTGPVLAAGKNLRDFRRDLLTAIGSAYVSTQAFVSVGQLRQVTVLVAGEVVNPGMRILTGLSNPLDAILLSGGVKKSGSLRSIKVIRHGKTITIDLYGVLARRSSVHLENLQDGDRVFVPSIGATVAVAGYVRRPAIYELPAGRQAVSAAELLSLANGPVLRGTYTVSLERIQPDGRGQFIDISGQPGASVRDGEVLILKAAVDISVGRVKLSGAVRTPGSFAVERYKTLHDLLPSNDAVEPGAYMLFGFVDRIDPKTLQHEAIPFSPFHVIAGTENLKLISYDSVHVMTTESMRTLLAAADLPLPNRRALAANFGRAVNGGSSSAPSAGSASPVPEVRTGPSLPAVAPADGASAQAAGGNTAGLGDVNASANIAMSDADAEDLGVGDNDVFFSKKLGEYRVSFNGAVHKPGTYLVAPNTTLAELIGVLGGLTQDVDLSKFELTSTEIDNKAGKSSTNRQYYPATDVQLAHLILRPYDRVEFHHVYSDRDTGEITIEGEVHNPGTYSILRGEHLSSVLKRAGGLTEAAYPYGTVFLRASVAAVESDQSKKAAADIRSQLFDVLLRPTSSNSSAPSAETIVALQTLLTQIEGQQALGRISVVADPAELAGHPKKDTILQPGDRIVVPKMPTSISVLGEVMRPGAFPVDEGMSARDFVEEAGGFTQFADTSRVIVVLPDGRARVDERSWLNLNGNTDLPPGTTIVVARDVTGITFHQFVMDTTQIISQFATTAAALAVLSTNIK